MLADFLLAPTSVVLPAGGLHGITAGSGIGFCLFVPCRVDPVTLLLQNASVFRLLFIVYYFLLLVFVV